MEYLKKIESSKTALELSPLEWKHYHPFETGGRRISPQLTRWRTDTRKAAESVARELVKRFGASKVLLFGSVARGNNYERSDIDLAVWGIPTKDFYRAVAFASGYSKDWKIDLVDAEDCRESVRRSILEEGVEL